MTLTRSDTRNEGDAGSVRADQIALDQTVRIEPDRRRLALRVLSSIFALVAISVGLLTAALHPNPLALKTLPSGFGTVLRVTALPWWTFIALGIAVATGAIGLLRSVYRLQDGDPALVVSPRGLSFRPTVFGEMARIPWTAIRGVRLRRYKQQRFLALQVEDADRYVARVGYRDRLLRLFGNRNRMPEITFSSPMSKDAWLRTEDLIRRYLDHYGRSTVPSDTSADPHRDTPPAQG